jgi:hypothetical protein
VRGVSQPSRLALGALLVFVAVLSLGPMAESDLFFRIKAGQEILAGHGLPGRNLFSFTYPDYPDIDTSWLFEVGAAALYGRGGFPGIVLAKTGVLLATFAGAFALCRRRGAGPVASALSLAAAAYAARDRFVERPHVFSLAGAVAVLAAIDVVAAATIAGDGRRRARAALALLVAVALWANLHAGVFVAVALLALAAVGAALDGRGGRDGRVAVTLSLLALGAAAATLATPVGFGLYRYLRLHTILPALHPVDEFRAASWVSDAPLLVYGAAVVGAVALARPRAWFRLLPIAGLALLALRSVRFGADFAVVAAPLLGVALSTLAPRIPLRAPAALGAAALLLGLGVAPRLAGRNGIGLDEGELPLEAIRFAEANGLRDRMYNDFEVGSYLAFEGYPRHRVFVDPRLPAYPPEMHRLLGRADLTRAEWSAALRRYGVDSALLAYAGLNRRVAWWDPAEWALVYRAHDARVFARRLPRFRALIAAREIPATFSFTPEEGAATVPLVDRPASSPVPDCEWQRRLGDLLFELDAVPSARARAAYERALAAPAGCLDPAEDARLAAWMGAVALGAGDARGAAALLDRALTHGDADLPTRANRALALERAGRLADAADAWADVAARGVGTPLGTKAEARRRALAR